MIELMPESMQGFSLWAAWAAPVAPFIAFLLIMVFFRRCKTAGAAVSISAAALSAAWARPGRSWGKEKAFTVSEKGW